MLTPAIAPFDPQPLRDRIVMITGGAQGIGRGIAQAVLAAGGRVVVIDIDRAAGMACMAEWDVGDRALFVAADVSREASVRHAIERALAQFGNLHGLVNNAGRAIPHTGGLQALSLADWRAYTRSHLDGAFLCSKHALPILRTARGAIVNIASSRAQQSEPHTEAYAAAKGGLVAFSHALAISEGPYVRVNVISPGWIATDAWRKPRARRAPNLSRRDHAQHPAGRVGQPEDIAHLAVYLLSDQSAFMTGQNVVVDGGMSRKMIYAD